MAALTPKQKAQRKAAAAKSALKRARAAGHAHASNKQSSGSYLKGGKALRKGGADKSKRRTRVETTTRHRYPGDKGVLETVPRAKTTTRAAGVKRGAIIHGRPDLRAKLGKREKRIRYPGDRGVLEKGPPTPGGPVPPGKGPAAKAEPSGAKKRGGYQARKLRPKSKVANAIRNQGGRMSGGVRYGAAGAPGSSKKRKRKA